MNRNPAKSEQPEAKKLEEDSDVLLAFGALLDSYLMPAMRSLLEVHSWRCASRALEVHMVVGARDR